MVTRGHSWSLVSTFRPYPGGASSAPLQALHFHLSPATRMALIYRCFWFFFFLSQSCNVTLRNAFTQQEISDGNYEIAQLFPSYDKVTLSNNCILTCRQQSNGHGGILALRAKTMNIDRTSKILTTGKGIL